MGQGSGSVTTFSRADGFATIGRHHEIVDAGSVIEVRLLGRELRLADLVVIGSHCIGLDYLLGELQRQGLHTKFLAVGSTAGLDAARRGECDVSGVHLLAPNTGTYNTPFVTPGLELVRGYGRLQGIVFRHAGGRPDRRNPLRRRRFGCGPRRARPPQTRAPSSAAPAARTRESRAP